MVELSWLPWITIAFLCRMAQGSITYQVTFYALAALGCGGCSYIGGGGGRLSRSCDDLLAKVTVSFCAGHTIHRYARLARRHCVAHPARVAMN